MSQQELLERLIGALDSAGVSYMVTGSVASSLQGEPRLTHDIDVVVELTRGDALAIAKAFPEPDYYVSEEAIHQALATEGMFNVLETDSGEKIDFWMLTDDPFDQSRFARRVAEQVGSVKMLVSSPEDTILMKLRWAKQAGGSEKQRVDALSVYEVQRGRLDERYLDDWAAKLGVADTLAKIREEAEP